ncbi:magnesium/cobalt transporter CorA [Conexibacter stalactiti]|uniref:Magnesium transport protein CorA n=1 Tax=Conexibacter stalactiti TaxID=1940611 RepID=A0ABU4HM74_9ACTN|nr:magnesium/cobalt transporter CorA [Conexibacter stalactiti]MDW5594345.1 magnesium/cobalt transporter CorA [Conexibacter stalactiti]MEC5034987.1 magnesium/cobalt transporter CorA [Conexibacter stalactiti]
MLFDAIRGDQLDDLLARRTFFWLDLFQPSDDELDMLADKLGWHPLAVEDTKEFEQRPKLDRYGDHMLLVFYGAHGLKPHHDDADGDRPALVEVHLLVSGDWIVTIRRHRCDALEELRHNFRHSGHDPESEQFVVYRILDVLTDTFFPVLDEIDETIDALEDAILLRADDEQLQRVFRLKRALGVLRRVVQPQRDLAQRAIEDINELPGLSLGARDYFRDVYDHLIRVNDSIESYRDLLTGLMDIYLSTTSNRMNAVMKQLTLVSTIFLPVTALTGFFGMNFGWMVGHIDGFWQFALFGVGGALFAALGLFAWFKRARFFD